MALRDYNPRPFSEAFDPEPTAGDAKSVERRMRLQIWRKRQKEIIQEALEDGSYAICVRILGNARLGRECYGNPLHTIRPHQIDDHTYAQECIANALFWSHWSSNQSLLEREGWTVTGRRQTVQLLTSLEQIEHYAETLELLPYIR